VDAESIVSCEITERLVLEEAFANAGAPSFGNVQVASQGIDEHKWLEAYRNFDYDTLRQGVADLLPEEEGADALTGPTSGAEGAAVEEIKAELEKELSDLREAAGASTETASVASPAGGVAMAGTLIFADTGTIVSTTGVAGTGTAAAAGAGEATAAVALAPLGLLLLLAVSAGVVIYVAAEVGEQEAARHRAIKIRVLQQLLAAATGAMMATTLEELIDEVNGILDEVVAKAPAEALKECIQEWLIVQSAAFALKKAAQQLLDGFILPPPGPPGWNDPQVWIDTLMNHFKGVVAALIKCLNEHTPGGGEPVPVKPPVELPKAARGAL
jgi:hypothetical protein